MTLVVDASVTAKWFIQEPETPFAEAILAQGPVIAPDLIVAEVTNVAWTRVRLGRLSLSQAQALSRKLGNMFAELIPCAQLAAHAIEIAIAFDHPIYDAYYLAVAESAKTELVTADGALFRKTRRTRFARLVRPLVR